VKFLVEIASRFHFFRIHVFVLILVLVEVLGISMQGAVAPAVSVRVASDEMMHHQIHPDKEIKISSHTGIEMPMQTLSGVRGRRTTDPLPSGPTTYVIKQANWIFLQPHHHHQLIYVRTKLLSILLPSGDISDNLVTDCTVSRFAMTV
jgi:hypothetical protein